MLTPGRHLSTENPKFTFEIHSEVDCHYPSPHAAMCSIVIASYLSVSWLLHLSPRTCSQARSHKMVSHTQAGVSPRLHTLPSHPEWKPKLPMACLFIMLMSPQSLLSHSALAIQASLFLLTCTQRAAQSWSPLLFPSAWRQFLLPSADPWVSPQLIPSPSPFSTLELPPQHVLVTQSTHHQRTHTVWGLSRRYPANYYEK